MSFDLRFWNNGEPVIPDESLTTLKYWLNGSPYTIYKAAAATTAIRDVIGRGVVPFKR